jgi:hypothetical protein
MLPDEPRNTKRAKTSHSIPQHTPVQAPLRKTSANKERSVKFLDAELGAGSDSDELWDEDYEGGFEDDLEEDSDNDTDSEASESEPGSKFASESELDSEAPESRMWMWFSL